MNRMGFELILFALYLALNAEDILQRLLTLCIYNIALMIKRFLRLLENNTLLETRVT